MKKIKIITIILLMILITMVGFFGIYKKVLNRMENDIKDYKYSMDLSGARIVTFKVDDSTKTQITDSEGKIIESATEEEIKEKGYKQEEVPVNGEEKLNKENYKLAKEIIEARLKSINNTITQENGNSSKVEVAKIKAEDYEISLNEENGEIVLKLPENSDTDYVVSSLVQEGKFEIADQETGETLLNKDDIAKATVLTYTAGSQTNVSFRIEFNGQGKRKISELRDKEKENKTENKTENTTTENVTAEDTTTENTTTENSTEEQENKNEITLAIKINGQDVYDDKLDTIIVNDTLTLSNGKTSEDKESLKQSLAQFQCLVAVLSNKDMPISYVGSSSISVAAENQEAVTNEFVIIVVTIAVFSIIMLIIKHKAKGLIVGFCVAGLVSLLLLILRVFNVIISLEGIVAVLISIGINFVFVDLLLKALKEDENNKKSDLNSVLNKKIKEFTLKVIPIFIISIVFAFTPKTPANSFGMVMFWGLTLIELFNILFTKNLIKYMKQ